MDLAYILEKIERAELAESPFLHLEVQDLFEKGDFDAIVASPEIALRPVANDTALFDELLTHNYRIISFPGCTTSFREYSKWHRNKDVSRKTNTACEGFGMIFRLVSPLSPAIAALHTLINSQDFVKCIAKRFAIDTANCTYDSGIQKYLDGYEISPHPDMRVKALTFMVNINPDPASTEKEHHTSYMRFKPQWQYVHEFWQGNPAIDRCWVPWDWCEVQTQQRKNNSMVIFSPNNSSLHAVKAKYDHLKFQRTQLYGNLWYKNLRDLPRPRWEDFVITPSVPSVTSRLKRKLSAVAQHLLNRSDTHATRKF